MRLDSFGKRVMEALRSTDDYPDEIKAWLPRFMADNPQFRLAKYQLPIQESINYVGGDGQPAFQNSWVNYGSSNEEAGYYKDALNRAFLCGLVKSGTSGSIVFTLPGSYRPFRRQRFGVFDLLRCGILDRGYVLNVFRLSRQLGVALHRGTEVCDVGVHLFRHLPPLDHVGVVGQLAHPVTDIQKGRPHVSSEEGPRHAAGRDSLGGT